MDMCIDFEVLVRGNTLAKSWARKILGRRKLGKFLIALQGGRCGLSNASVAAIQAIPPDEKKAILATGQYRDELFKQFDKLAIKIARNFARMVGRENEADISQLESEARLGLLKAIRGYARLETKFITYAYRVISNEVSRFVHRTAGLTGINAPLLVRYKRKVEELSLASLPNSFEDVCRELELSAAKVRRLQLALRGSAITTESEMEDSLASIILDNKKNDKVDFELIKKLESVSLPLIEQLAFISQKGLCELFPDAFPSLKHAAEHLGVTPQAMSEALKRARKKLATSLSEWQ